MTPSLFSVSVSVIHRFDLELIAEDLSSGHEKKRFFIYGDWSPKREDGRWEPVRLFSLARIREFRFIPPRFGHRTRGRPVPRP